MKSSKEIALDLGISPHTVDRRLKDAMRLLGASSRVDAAKMMAASATCDYQPLAYQPPAVGGRALPPEKPVHGAALATHVAEDRADFDPRILPQTESARFIRWRKRHELNVWQKLLVILGVMLASPLMLGALAGALMIARSFYRSLS